MNRFDLGHHTKSVSTTSKDAQYWFDMGLNWCYGFNHEEGIACFQKALTFDPNCVMAHWGAAYAVGPFYNNLWRQFSQAEANIATKMACFHIESARRAATPATPLEHALLDALSKRFQQPRAVSGEDYDQWDQDYADAMRAVYADFPDDHDVMALAAEALMTRTAWRLWDLQTGEVLPGSDTLEALAIIERSIAMHDAANTPQHPAILHLHIHCVEMSANPEDARRSADILGTLCPDAGHMNHMPGHVYALSGNWDLAKAASEKAIRADNLYVDYAGAFNFYTTARCHDLHLMMYACMFLGQFTAAQSAAEQIAGTLSKDVLSAPGSPQRSITMEGYYSMTAHALVRFGRWQDIIDLPLPDDEKLYCVTIPMQHYAKTVAHTALKNIPQAQAQRAAFYKAVKQIPKEREFFNNPAIVILGVAEQMLEGELAYHKGEHDTAFDHLRDAVTRCDNLYYSEPWPWMHPPRHALGALLTEQGHYTEAEQVYRADLGLDPSVKRCVWHPNNVWALHGLVECLKHRNAEELPAFQKQLSIAQAKTETPVTAACLCRASKGKTT